MFNLIDHLKERHLETDLYQFITIDPKEGVVTFPLWNLSGQMVGYQVYRPGADKKKKNHPKEGRYYTFLSGDKKSKAFGVWGMESLSYSSGYLVVCEGIFDACRLHNHGIPCIAILSSDTKYFKNLLTCLGRKIIVVEDDHGSKLGQYTKVTIPDCVNDIGDCTEDQIFSIVSDIKEILK